MELLKSCSLPFWFLFFRKLKAIKEQRPLSIYCCPFLRIVSLWELLQTVNFPAGDFRLKRFLSLIPILGTTFLFFKNTVSYQCFMLWLKCKVRLWTPAVEENKQNVLSKLLEERIEIIYMLLYGSSWGHILK